MKASELDGDLQSLLFNSIKASHDYPFSWEEEFWIDIVQMANKPQAIIVQASYNWVISPRLWFDLYHLTSHQDKLKCLGVAKTLERLDFFGKIEIEGYSVFSAVDGSGIEFSQLQPPWNIFRYAAGKIERAT